MNQIQCLVTILVMSTLIHSFVFPIRKLARIKIDRLKKSQLAEMGSDKNGDKISALDHTIDRIADFKIILQPNGTITAGNCTIASTANATITEILEELEHLVFMSRPRYG